MAAAVSSITDHNLYTGQGQPTRRRVAGKANLGTLYATDGIVFGVTAIQAGIDTALGRTDVDITAVHEVLISNPSDPAYLFSYVSATGKVKCHIQPAAALSGGVLPVLTPGADGVLTLNTLPGETFSDQLTVLAHVSTLPAGRVPLAVESILGTLTGPLAIQYTAPGSGECRYDPAAGTITCAAADVVGAIRVLMLSLGTDASKAADAIDSLAAGTLPAVASPAGRYAEAGAVNLSAITFDFVAIVS
jgi:hypothetical protein